MEDYFAGWTGSPLPQAGYRGGQRLLPSAAAASSALMCEPDHCVDKAKIWPKPSSSRGSAITAPDTLVRLSSPALARKSLASAIGKAELGLHGPYGERDWETSN